MCDVHANEVKPGEIEVVCTISGKPVTVSNEYGMFCEDMCDLEEAKQAHAQLNSMISNMAAMFGIPEDE